MSTERTDAGGRASWHGELLMSDMRLVMDAMNALDDCCKALEGAHVVELHVTNECGDIFVIGYGENAEAAVLRVVSDSSGGGDA